MKESGWRSVLHVASRRFDRASTLGRLGRRVYDRYLRHRGAERGIQWSLNGLEYRIDPAYRGQIGHSYDEELSGFLRSAIRPGDVWFNVGANIGVHALQLSRWSAPDGIVVAFEPNPGALAVLRRHVAWNELEDRVLLAPVAVSDEVGETVLFGLESDARSRLGAPNPELSEVANQVVVEVTTLDAYVREAGITPDWMLIDIEGFEIRALAGARDLIRERGHRLRVVVEMHPNVWDSADTTRADAEALLAELRLQATPLSGQRDPLGEYGHVLLAPATTPPSIDD